MPSGDASRPSALLAPFLFLRILSRNMRPAVEVPGFISEYLRLCAAALAPAVVGAVVGAVDLFIRRLPGQLRSMRAASWPLTQGTGTLRVFGQTDVY